MKKKNSNAHQMNNKKNQFSYSNVVHDSVLKRDEILVNVIPWVKHRNVVLDREILCTCGI